MSTNGLSQESIYNSSARGEILAPGFGTAAAMWVVGYFCHIPPAVVASPIVLLLLLLCLFGGGFLAGRYSSRGWLTGFKSGLVTGALNLLILGSLISGDDSTQIIPSALVWIPGSFLVCGGVSALGGLAGSVVPAVLKRSWTNVFAWVACAATFFLIVIGGIVTGQEAGLTVVDWPNSFGYNMFLYPLSRMTGGIYFEHAHRLFGSLVGLTTLVLCIHIHRVDKRNWVKRLVDVCLAMVILQGILGGLRVTGHFTWSTSPDQTAPNIGLAIMHGVLGQVFFATLVSVAFVTSKVGLSNQEKVQTASAGTERTLSILLNLFILVQIGSGAVLRHTTYALLVHITFAVIVAAFALTCGIRAWGLYPSIPLLQRLGLGLMALTGVQLILGLCALVAIGVERPDDYVPTHADVIFTTIHQATGAILLALSTFLMCLIHAWTELE